MDDLQQRIDQLERKLKREKTAREEAERLLESKSRELYELNQQVQEKYNEAKLQQQQLSFLTGLSADTWLDCTITELTHKFVARAHEFLIGSTAVFGRLTKDKIDNAHIVETSASQLAENDVIAFCQSLNHPSLFQRLHSLESESDLVELAEFTDKTLFSVALFVPVYQLSEVVGTAIFFYKSFDDIDILKLQTIESSRTLLNGAIQRKLASQTLKKRYQELKTTYEKLEQVQQQLLQSEKMASLGQLAAGVAHEINNPIGFVLSNYQTLSEYLQVVDQMFHYANLLIEEPSQSHPLLGKLNELWEQEDLEFIREDLTELMNASHKGLRRVQEIVAGLKSFSHSDTDTFEKIDIKTCLEDSLQMVWNELKYNVEVDKQFADVAKINANSGQLQQVFVNLFVNAKQAMENGGTLTLSISNEKTKEGEWVKVIVADTGSGISKENQKQLFTPFFTTKPVGFGTGLGLSVSYGILQNHGATIDVESEIGKGTRFIISFPAV